MTREELLKHGFREIDGIGRRDKGRVLFFRSISGGLGFNFGIDLKNEQCFTFEGDRSTAFPYPIDAVINQYFTYPKDIQSLDDIFKSITGYSFIQNYV